MFHVFVNSQKRKSIKSPLAHHCHVMDLQQRRKLKDLSAVQVATGVTNKQSAIYICTFIYRVQGVSKVGFNVTYPQTLALLRSSSQTLALPRSSSQTLALPRSSSQTLALNSPEAPLKPWPFPAWINLESHLDIYMHMTQFILTFSLTLD